MCNVICNLPIGRFIELQRQSTRFICMFIRVKWLFHSVIVLQIMKSPPPPFDETIPGRVSSFWTHQQGPSRHDQKPKSHICNNMKNLVSIYYKFLRTHHTRSACYHFGTGIPSVSKMQYTTQRVYSKRDLFETLTSMNIARDHHNRIIH